MSGKITITCVQCNHTYVLTEQPTTWKTWNGGLVCQHCWEKESLEIALRFIMNNTEAQNRPASFHNVDRETFYHVAKLALEELSPLTPDDKEPTS